MRTTIRLKDTLLKRAKRYALEHDTTFTTLVEEALEEKLARSDSATPFKLLTAAGEERPGVNVSDNKALRDLMDGLE